MIELSTSSTTVTVTVSGELDIAEREQFPEATARLRALRRQLVVVDLCAATFIDSTGVAFLTSLAHAAARRGGVTVLRGARARDLLVLEVCGALGFFRLDREHRCPAADAPAGSAAAG